MKKLLSLVLATVILTIAVPAISSAYSARIVGNSKSMIYHNPDCRTIKKLSKEYWVEFQSTEEAVSAGYRACLVCHP